MKLGRTIAVAPIVEQSNKQQFEDFAYDYFASNPRIPSSTGEKPFGRGIFAGNPIYEVPYQLDRTGVTLWGSPYTFYYPILEIGDVSVLPVERLVMYNLHSDPAVGRLLDQVYDCSQAYIAEHGTSVGHKCSYLTDLLEILLIPDTQLTAKMVHVQPIFPENDKDTMTGIISVNVDWLDILEEALPDRQSGIDCLVETATTKFSMTFENGKAKGLSYGDVTDKRFNQYKNSKSIQLQGSNSNRSSDITVTFYPKYEFYSNYRTDTPLYACIIVVLVEVILSITFFVYDYYMKRESSLHEQILDAKKQFVRFISHEVRTPLNSVSMGLSLLTGELVAAIENGTFTILEKNDSGSSRKSPEVLIKGWKKLLAELSVNVDDASVVLNDLLNYDKMERENSKIDVAAVDIKRLLEKTYHLFEVPAENVGVNLVLDLHELTMPHDIESHITVDPFDQIPPLFSLRCLGDETRLAQVLRNIVSNAVKFTPAAGTVIIKGS